MNQRRKLYPIEIALCVGVLAALIWGAGTMRTQEKLADSLIRLHVVANSDDAEDQRRKLLVRDAILKRVEDCGAQVRTPDEMAKLLEAEAEELERIAEEVLRAEGDQGKVTAQVTDCYFPTKDYNGFALPAGQYRALRIVIGDGEGTNWWCVAFPPLCVGASSKTIEEAVQAGYFTEKEAEFLRGETSGYILKFRSLELLGQLKNLLFPVTE